MFPNFTCHKAIDLKIHWPFCKLHCDFVTIWWFKFENHWPWASCHCILETLHTANTIYVVDVDSTKTIY